MMTASPLVSVLMTAFNREAFIAEAIESVLASSLADFELLVVDDASRDETVRIAQNYAQRDARVKVHVNEANLGDYPNRNHVASLARGKYLKYLDSDDAIYPHALAVMVGSMEQFPDAGLGLSAFADAGSPHPLLLDPAAAYRRHFFGKDLFGRAPGSAIIRAEAFRAAGGFTGKRQVGDHEFWLILARRWSVVTMPRDLIWDRTHGGQEQFFDSDAEKARMHWAVDIDALAHRDCPLSEQERELARRALSRQNAKAFWRQALRHGSPRAALRFRRALQLSWAELFDLGAPQPDRAGQERATP